MADEKVEMEQVPLKSDTDEMLPADETSETAAEGGALVTTTTEVTKTEDGKEVTKTTTTTKKPFFSWPKKKPKKEAPRTDDETVEKNEGAGTEVPPAEHKSKTDSLKRFFSKKNGGAAPNDTACNMTIGINMLDRDERNLNEHVKLPYEEVYGEPDSFQSWDCVWRLNYRVFTTVRLFLYRLLALILVLPLAIVFAVVFAVLTVANIWCCIPCGRALTIPATWLARSWNFVIRSLFDPIFRSCGLCFSSVTVRRYGLSADPTADAHIA